MILDQYGKAFSAPSSASDETHLLRCVVKELMRKGGEPEAVMGALDRWRKSSRVGYMTQPMVLAATNRYSTKVMGPGLEPRPKANNRVLKLSQRALDRFHDKAAEAMGLWSEKACLDGTSFQESQDEVLRGRFIAGDCFTKRVHQKFPGDIFGLKVQTIRGGRCGTPPSRHDKKTLKSGIEFDQYSRPIGYWFSHEGDHGQKVWPTTPCPARDSMGGWITLHHRVRPMPEVVRGVPLIAGAAPKLRMIDEFFETSLMGDIISNLFTVAITTPDGKGPEQVLGDKPLNGESNFDLGLGNVAWIKEGTKIDTVKSDRPNRGFKDAIQAAGQFVAAALGLPYSIIMGKFDQNYSSARGELLEAWEVILCVRAWLVRSYCNPCYSAVIDEAVRTGFLKAPGYVKDARIRRAYLGVRWRGPRMGHLDPLKEIKAILLAVNGLLQPIDEYFLDHGDQLPQIETEQAALHAIRKMYGAINPDGDSDPDDEETAA